MREDLARGSIELGAPRHRPAKDGLHTHPEAAIACEHLAVGEAHPSPPKVETAAVA
jgi:hypothetical protein